MKIKRKQGMGYPEALSKALCALSFFRARNLKQPRFRRATKEHNQSQVVSNRCRYVELARKFVRQARELGFAGSIREQVSAVMENPRPIKL